MRIHEPGLWPARGLQPFRHPSRRPGLGPSRLASVPASTWRDMILIFYSPPIDIDSISHCARSSVFSVRRSCSENGGDGLCSVDRRSCRLRRDLSSCAHDRPEIEADRVEDTPAARAAGGQVALLWRTEKSDVSVAYCLSMQHAPTPLVLRRRVRTSDRPTLTSACGNARHDCQGATPAML
jgi:hypothetical protein